MTRLEQAIQKLKQFPKKQQEFFASMILDEAAWNETFKRTQRKLAKLGKTVLEDIQAGKFKGMRG